MTEIGHVLLVMALCLEALVAPHPGPPAARWGGHQGSIGTKSGTPGLPKGKSSRAVEAYRLNVVRPRCLRRRLVGADRDAAMGFMVHDLDHQRSLQHVVVPPLRCRCWWQVGELGG